MKNERVKFIRRLFYPEKCPICGAYNCYKFLGFYFRPVFDEHGTFFKDFPIARFKCYQKGTNIIVQHKTFSLLPYQLIPYCKYSIPFIIKILKMEHINEKSVMEIQELLSNHENSNGYIDLAQSTIYKFKDVIEDAITKLLAAAYYPVFNSNMLNLRTEKEKVIVFITFAMSFAYIKLSGPCALGFVFFLTGGGYIKNSLFLFGTPSQFRD